VTVPVVGLLLTRSFIIFHDCCHDSYTPNKNINYVLSTIYGITVFTSPNWILDHHIHHLTSGNMENKYNFKFNELVYYTKSQYCDFTPTSKLIFHVFHAPIIFFSVVPILYFGIIQRFIYIVKKLKYRNKINASLFTITCNHIINNIGAYCILQSAYNHEILIHLLTAYFISFVIGFILFFNQHTFNPAYVVRECEWTQPNSGLLGSSFIQVPYYLKYFTAGIEYHHIHHMNSKIPGYNIQKCHESGSFDVIQLSMYDCFTNMWLVLYDAGKYISIDDIKKCN